MYFPSISLSVFSYSLFEIIHLLGWGFLPLSASIFLFLSSAGKRLLSPRPCHPVSYLTLFLLLRWSKAFSLANKKTCFSLSQELAKPDQGRIMSYWFKPASSSEEKRRKYGKLPLERDEDYVWQSPKKQLLFTSA